MPESDPAAAARKRLLAAESDTIDVIRNHRFLIGRREPPVLVDAVLGAADAVTTVGEGAASGWFRLDDGRLATSDREAVVPELREELANQGLLHELTGLLATAVDAAGYELSAPPVPAPPYLAVTSTGPVLRATVDAGRLVVRIDCFEVVRGVEAAGENGIAYARTNAEPAAALSVSFER